MRIRNSTRAYWAPIAAMFVLNILFLPQPALAQAKDSLTIEVSRDGQAKVTEQLMTSTTVSRITVSAITASVSNILAVDENNIVLSFSNEGSSITIDTLGSANVTLTYHAGIAKEVASDIWELNYESSEIQSTLVLPSMSEIIYVNDIPIDIVDNVVKMPSGETSLRYRLKNVDTRDFVVEWDQNEYMVHIVTASSIQGLSFDQSSKSILFSLDAGTAVLVIVPKSLLGGPYSVTGATGDPLDFKQYYQNATHSWIRIEPNESSTVRIVGTTVVPEFSFAYISAGVVMVLVLIIASLRKKFLFGSRPSQP